MFSPAQLKHVRTSWPLAADVSSRRELAKELKLSPLELFQLALAAGLRVCEKCDLAEDHVVAVFTRRSGGDCVHVCRLGRDARKVALDLVSASTDPFEDYLFYEGRRCVLVAAVADTFVVGPDGVLLQDSL